MLHPWTPYCIHCTIKLYYLITLFNFKQIIQILQPIVIDLFSKIPGKY